jgi:hypothetical protein
MIHESLLAKTNYRYSSSSQEKDLAEKTEYYPMNLLKHIMNLNNLIVFQGPPFISLRFLSATFVLRVLIPNNLLMAAPTAFPVDKTINQSLIDLVLINIPFCF